jgi:hypothetical protein
VSISPLRAFFEIQRSESSLLYYSLDETVNQVNGLPLYLGGSYRADPTMNTQFENKDLELNQGDVLVWEGRTILRSKGTGGAALWCLSGNASSSLGRNSRSVVMVLKLHEQEGNNVLKHVNIDLQRCMMMRESQGFVCFSCKSRLHRYVCSIEGVARRTKPSSKTGTK